MVMIVAVMVCSLSQAPQRPRRHADHNDPRANLEIRLGGFNIPLATERERHRGVTPNHQRLRKCRRKSQQRRLNDRSPYPDGNCMRICRTFEDYRHGKM